MREPIDILHVGAAALPNEVDGVNTTVWNVAQYQAGLGRRVALLLSEPPGAEVAALAQARGLELIVAPVRRWRYAAEAINTLLQESPPRVVHMHSVFVPHQAALAFQLQRHGIPYVITPHGGLAAQVLERERLKKRVYSMLVEKRRFAKAAAVTAVLPREEREIQAFVSGYAEPIPWIPNPVEADSLEAPAWGYETARSNSVKHLVYLGRFDVLHKGIDLLIELARLLPDIELHLYGRRDRRTAAWLDTLMSDPPPNVTLHGPVYGSDKARVIASATLYVQMSRWEAFGIAIAEAMYVGVPCAISETANFADIFRQHDLGLVMSPNPVHAAQSIAEILNQPDLLARWSRQGQAFARERFHPQAVARSYLDLYEHVISELEQGEVAMVGDKQR